MLGCSNNAEFFYLSDDIPPRFQGLLRLFDDRADRRIVGAKYSKRR